MVQLELADGRCIKVTAIVNAGHSSRHRRQSPINEGPGWLKRYVAPVVVVVLLMLLWQAGTTLAPSPFFPPPLRIISSSWTMFFTGPPEHFFLTPLMIDNGLTTFGRMLIGFLLGSIVGAVLGIVSGLSQLFRETTSPVVEFLRSVPASATLPLFIILLGGEDGMRVAFIAYGVMWFVLINTAHGVQSIHPTQIMMGRSFRLSRARQVFTIVLPAALAQMFAGLRIALSASLIFAVLSEFMVATNGIGYELINTQARFQFLAMWSWMFLLAVAGLVANVLLELVEGRVLRWHRLFRNVGK